MSILPVRAHTTEGDPRVEMLRTITDLVALGLPAPLTVLLHTYGPYVGDPQLELRLDDNRPDHVRAWSDHVGLECQFDHGGHVFADTKGKDPWRNLGCAGTWLGWWWRIWAAVDVAVDSTGLDGSGGGS